MIRRIISIWLLHMERLADIPKNLGNCRRTFDWLQIWLKPISNSRPAYAANKRHQEASQYYKRAIKLTPGYQEAHLKNPLGSTPAMQKPITHWDKFI